MVDRSFPQGQFWDSFHEAPQKISQDQGFESVVNTVRQPWVGSWSSLFTPLSISLLPAPWAPPPNKPVHTGLVSGFVCGGIQAKAGKQGTQELARCQAPGKDKTLRWLESPLLMTERACVGALWCDRVRHQHARTSTHTLIHSSLLVLTWLESGSGVWVAHSAGAQTALRLLACFFHFYVLLTSLLLLLTPFPLPHMSFLFTHVTQSIFIFWGKILTEPNLHRGHSSKFLLDGKPRVRVIHHFAGWLGSTFWWFWIY